MHMRKIYAAILTAGAMAAYAIVALAGPNDPIPLSGYVRVQNGGTGAQTLSGLLKGNGTSAVTTATGSDITSSFTGTCDSTTFLRGDGTCDYARVENGGTGAQTLSGILKGNGTSAVTTATGSDITSSFTGTCDATTWVRGDGSCQSNTGASLSGNNTWTGQNLFSGTTNTTSVGTTLAAPGVRSSSPVLQYTRSGNAANNRVFESGMDSTGFYMEYINDAFSVGREAFRVNFSSGSTAVSSISIGNTTDNPTISGNGVDMTPSTGSGSGNLTTACTTTPSQSFTYNKIGNTVFLSLSALGACTSDSTVYAMDAGSLPAAIRPAATRCAGFLAGVDNTTNSVMVAVGIGTNGSVNYAAGPVGCTNTNWTTSGNKSMSGGTVVYTLN